MSEQLPHNPLTQAHLEKLNQVLKMCPETDLIIQQAVNSGIPAEQAQIENRQQMELAMALKRNFFPTAP